MTQRPVHSVCPGAGAPLARFAACAFSAWALMGCSPAFDWRSVALSDTGLVAELPCRPGRFQREVEVAGSPLRWFMLSCEAGGVTYGVATADVGDPTRVEAVLAAVADNARQAMHAQSMHTEELVLPGATPFKNNVSAHLRGARPDGGPVQESLRVFARGARVFEVSAVGTELPAQALAPFQDGLHFELEKPRDNPS